MTTGCWTRFGRCILIFMNFFLELFALAVLGLGVFLKYSAPLVLQVLLGGLQALSRETREQFHIPDISHISQPLILERASLILIVAGCVLFLISFLPYCGASCLWRPLLILFVVLMSALVLAQAVAGGMFLTKDSVMHKALEERVGEEVKENFEVDGEDALSVTVNLLNYQLGCCGIRGWKDFPAAGRPPSCCNRTIIEGGSEWGAARNACMARPPTAPDTFYSTQGCYSLLRDAVLSELTATATVFVLVLLFEILEIVFACLLVRDLNQKYTSKVEPYER